MSDPRDEIGIDLSDPPDWRDQATALAAEFKTTPLELLRRRVEANHETAALRRDLKRFSRLLAERVARPGGEWLDVGEVAQRLRMSVRSVYVDLQRRPSGELARAATRVGRRLRFSREGIDSMLRQSLRPGTRSVLLAGRVPVARNGRKE